MKQRIMESAIKIHLDAVNKSEASPRKFFSLIQTYK